MHEATLVAVDRDDIPTTRAGTYGRCASCGNLKVLDGNGYPFPHNHFLYRSAKLRVRRCEGEHLPARRPTVDVA